MTTTWIVVAEQGRARIFESDASHKLKAVRDVLHDAGRHRNRDIETDRPGTSFSRVGPGRRSMTKDGHGVKHSTVSFIGELANFVDQARHLGRFAELKVIAAPAFLGELKKQLSNPTLALLTTTWDKDLAHASTHEVVQFMEDEGVVPAAVTEITDGNAPEREE